jgi:hypothetical protein
MPSTVVANSCTNGHESPKKQGFDARLNLPKKTIVAIFCVIHIFWKATQHTSSEITACNYVSEVALGAGR